MDETTSSIMVVVLGVLILLASLTADMIGLGNEVGFGPKQGLGAVVGVIVLAIGIDLYKSRSTTGNWPE